MRRRTISKAVQRDLEAIAARSVVVAAAITVTTKELDAFERLGLLFENGRFTTRDPAPPPRSCGLCAVRNLEGWDEKRKDLAKESRDISSWAPNWHGSGFHSITRTIDAWPLEHHAARMNTISVVVLEYLHDAALVRFRIDQPLDRDSPMFERDLAFNLRLLREAVGEAKVYPSDMSDEEFTLIQRVDWELLPPGSAERILTRLASRKTVTEERLTVARLRLNVLERLGPDGFVIGRGSFSSYFGAKFGSRLVVLENLEYGNALYAMEEDWEELSQLSRSELIRRRDPGVRRIPHVPGWQSAIRKLLRR
jgi:hypothetical protein